ncbi:MAG: ComEC/Rec2 family competence protein [Chthoniobacterales bacterium]
MKWFSLPSPFFDFVQESLKGRRFPFLGLVSAAIAGILTQEFFSFSGWMIFWITLSLGLSLLVFIWKKFLPKKIEQVLFFLFVAFFFAVLHAWQWQESPAREVASVLNKSGNDIAVEGMVVSEVKVSPSHNASFFLRVNKVDSDSSERGLPVTMLVRWEGALPARGDRLALRALPSVPRGARNPGEFNEATWLARQQVYTVLKMDPADPGCILSSGGITAIMRWAEASRKKIEQWISLGITDDLTVMRLIKAVALGAHESELVDFLGDFKLTGTLHLFAVSGLHVGMLAVIIWFFLKWVRLPRWSAVVVTIPLLFFYVAITGFRIGSLRAAIMTSLVLSGFLFYRRPQMINSLAAAAFFLLLLETNLLFSMGWQFSFCVVFSIVLLASPFQKIFHTFYALDPFLPKKFITPWHQWRHDFCQHLAQLLAVSAAAWVGSVLPCIFYFHLLSFSSLGANVLAVPLAFLILSLAALSALLGSFFPWIATIFNNSNWLCAKLLLLVVHGFALLPLSSFSVGLSGRLHPRLTIFDLPSAQAAVLQAEGRTWAINAGRSRNATQTLLPFFEAEGTTHLQGMVLTEKEAAHLGGALPLLQQIPADSFFSSAGEGSSFLFKHFLKGLTVSHQKLILLHEGECLNFSPSCSAEVLYPPATSSDSALVLRMQLARTTLLLMPSSSLSLQSWLVAHTSLKQLQSTILVLPDMKQPLEESFLKAVAPRLVIVGTSPFEERDHSHLVSQTLASRFEKHGIIFLEQSQTGAVILDVLPTNVNVHPFLNDKEDAPLDF